MYKFGLPKEFKLSNCVFGDEKYIMQLFWYILTSYCENCLEVLIVIVLFMAVFIPTITLLTEK